ncbi:ECF-type riboflavin transporter substrate-binding protein [Streptococcus massiliensis]|uniref:UPF0397 protein NCTC13765_01829 n=1 Tax=Streptococcus massiliensis TaxID=313439 RepID=A0A380L481_9STRE|nr:ECF-type riboflavin transporter substrate-binding protein [Streptococcus massiliensis]SUN77311.1 UPF0397 protein SSU05 [Streptococcus massiliensis]
MKNTSIKNVVATGIGAALFVIIGILVNIPLPIPNTSVQLQYALQALFSLLFGPVVGFLIGFIGHALKDAIQFGSPWWSWVLVSGVFGLVIGLARKQFKIEEGIFARKDILRFNVLQVVANAIGWGIIAPLGDILIYSEAPAKVFAQGIWSTVANSLVVGIAGTLLLVVYAGSRTKAGSLKKD